MKVHFIAIGGSAMHNLAIALHKKGFQVTGSDDEVFEPSKSRLKQLGLLPDAEGWFPGKITPELDAIILGMHARPDNPELQRARELNLKVYSYPEYLFEQTKDKKRIVIAGSHGKTTITSMLLHVLKTLGRKFDFMVGAQIKGFDTMVELSEEAEIAIFEGDEYLSSPVDLRPKFLWYRPHVALVTGVAWDHINVFPTEKDYNDQFRLFADTIIPGGAFIYYNEDLVLQRIAKNLRGLKVLPYQEVEAISEGDGVVVQHHGSRHPLKIFGRHNYQNLAGALLVAEELGISGSDFWKTMETFEGASRRLQVLAHNDHSSVFYDFAHAPSKVKATVEAVRERFPNRKLLAIVELHTFSSLNRDFLPQYHGALNEADETVVYFNPQVVEHKKLPGISVEDIEEAFAKNGLKVFMDERKLKQFLEGQSLAHANLLLMTSGNLAGIDVKALSQKIIHQ